VPTERHGVQQAFIRAGAEYLTLTTDGDWLLMLADYLRRHGRPA
jgi:hypothetical protein